MNINSIIVQNDGRPSTDPLPEFLEQWLTFDVNIPTGNTADIDMNTGAIQSTDPFWDQWYGDSDNPDIILHIERLFFEAQGPTFAALDIDEKYKLIKNLQLKVRQGGKDFAYNVGQYVRDPWEKLVVTEATASDGEYATYNSLGVFELPRPITINLANDRLQLGFAAAAPTVTGGVDLRMLAYSFVFRAEDASKGSQFEYKAPNGSKVVIPSPGGKVCAGRHCGFDKLSGSKAARRLLGRK